MPWTQGTYAPPNNFVQQYDLGQKKIRADLVDENFNDAASAINTLKTNIDNNDAAAVHLSGAETISGDKTFTGDTTFSGNLEIPESVVTDVAVALDGSNLAVDTAVKTVVETWHSGAAWYRVWSDGWIEQGGRTSVSNQTVTLFKPYSDTNYTVLLTVSTPAVSSRVYSDALFTTTQFSVAYSQQNNAVGFWYACGY